MSAPEAQHCAELKSMSADVSAALLQPEEPPAFDIVNPDGAGRGILVCDHASRRIPKRLGTLGVDPRELSRHIAWDIGAAEVARRLSVTLDVPLVLCGYSRLVMDCNRPHWADDAFTTLSEDVEIPGNRNLAPGDRKMRVDEIFRPYQAAVDRVVQSRLGGAHPPIMVSVHSFTPIYLGEGRPWDIGVHYRLDERLARLCIEGLRRKEGLHVGENEPYQLALGEDFTIPVHAEARGLPHVLFEIRQDHLASPAGIETWSSRLGTLLAEAFEDPSLGRLAPPAPDVREWRFQQAELPT